VSSQPKPATIPLQEAARRWPLERDHAYKLARTGQLAPGVPVIKAGGRYYVPVAPFERALGIADLAKDSE
jgi:hypothetical protein